MLRIKLSDVLITSNYVVLVFVYVCVCGGGGGGGGGV